jgi:hypothetical protein
VKEHFFAAAISLLLLFLGLALWEAYKYVRDRPFTRAGQWKHLRAS